MAYPSLLQCGINEACTQFVALDATKLHLKIDDVNRSRPSAEIAPV